MDNGLYLGLQAQRVLQRQMDAAANNMANVSTTGFKADMLVQEEVRVRPAQDRARPNDIRFSRDVGMARDFGQGPIEATGAPLDLAIRGEGFFAVQGPDGPLYTRAGAFTLSGDGTLTTPDGAAVLNAGGQPIVFDPRGERPSIAADGRIFVAGAEVARIGLVAFDNPALLAKVGEAKFDAQGQPTRAAAGEIAQGALERSNVNAVAQLTELIEISRAYERASRIVRQGDELRQRAVDRLGRTQ